MKTWRWTLFLVSAGALAFACNGDETTEDDTGPTTTSTGGATGSVTASSTSVMMQSSSTGMMGCDTGVAGEFDFSPGTVCLTCAQCAVAGPCMAEADECPYGTGASDMPDPNNACDAYLACADGCRTMCDLNMNMQIDEGDMQEEMCWDGCFGDPMVDPPTPGTCLADEAAGADLWLALLSCIVCGTCQQNCDAATNCM